ncbi:MAG: HAMP domain-containing histidine kinase [candidate division KSB1 bacterium]|nr:HAMP domain-containing histidine kinase [candidate division KSB1 bacterium]MDZ7393201.1 HAMP domain-containing histidine kinase [candidate division KSB1 bacterium]MDZ7413910.1 HAMP domain-containing histidine kinase [candidate division KSB1 bacterium]
MVNTLYTRTGRFKGLLFVLVAGSVVGLLLYTQQLVAKLRADARQIVTLWANTYEKIIGTENDEQSSELIGFFFEEVIMRINFPAIQTDVSNEPQYWRNVGLDENDRSPATLAAVKKMLRNMARENEPIVIRAAGQDLGYIYYGDSRLITHLRYLPYVEIAVVSLVVLVAFVGYSSIKRSEQRFLWVGMAKETAHQLGTPISSLMGWLDLIKQSTSLEQVAKTAAEMSRDVHRLEKVAARFSQIGARQELRPQPLAEILGEVAGYLRRRLPQMDTRTEIIEDYQQVPATPVNRDLIEWAVENLVKNALEALPEGGGVVTISLGLGEKGRTVYIDVKDTGRGIHSRHRREIFKPGFSTKRRGWGLGLNLAKRIVEDYHHGKLFIKETKVGVGTTMRIVLPLR